MLNSNFKVRLGHYSGFLEDNQKKLISWISFDNLNQLIHTKERRRVYIFIINEYMFLNLYFSISILEGPFK